MSKDKVAAYAQQQKRILSPREVSNFGFAAFGSWAGDCEWITASSSKQANVERMTNSFQPEQ